MDIIILGDLNSYFSAGPIGLLVRLFIFFLSFLFTGYGVRSDELAF